MWEAVLVLLIAGLAISRIASVVNEILASVVPEELKPTKLSGARVILWVVAAIFAVVAVTVVEYDPIAATGMAEDADDIWNILFLIAAADAADAFFVGRLVRS